MEEDNNVNEPKLRFPGFTGAWEQCELGKVAIRVTRKNRDLESTLPLTISAQDGLIDQNDFFNKTVASRDLSGYYLIKKGEFAYNKSYSNGYPWGAVKRLDRYQMGVLSTLYIVFKLTGIDSDFLSKYYDSDIWYKEVSKHAAEGARNHGLLNIAATDFFKTELTIPVSNSEQKQIGLFFNQLDNLITLHQRKLNNLKNKKKGLLQKMFPKEGEKYPEIRISGFTDAWEQRKLGEMMNITSVKRIHQSDWTNEGVRFLRARDIVSYFKNEEPNDCIFISQEKYDEYSALSGKVSIGDMLVTGVGTIGIPLLIRDINSIYFKDGNIIWFQNNGKVEGNFFYYSFIGNSIQSFIREAAGTGTVGTYTIDSGKKTPILLPDKNEQKQIGGFFKQLDNLITLHQRKLDHLKERKKSLLEQMFI